MRRSLGWGCEKLAVETAPKRFVTKPADYDEQDRMLSGLFYQHAKNPAPESGIIITGGEGEIRTLGGHLTLSGLASSFTKENR